MRDIDAAYLAGYIDGDGHIGITLKKRPLGGKQHLVQMEIASTEKNVPEMAFLEFGGSLGLRRRYGKNKDLWRWIITGKKTASVINVVKKYMVLKIDQADIALRFVDTIKQRGSKLTEQEFAHRENLRGMILALNERGGQN